jgi:uncharacterized protein YdcH (DUF465 family)
MSIEWIIGLSISIVCSLIGVIYLTSRARDDRQDARTDSNEAHFAQHIKDDNRMHERIVRQETKMETLEAEVAKLRDMRHEILDSVTHRLAEWHTEIIAFIRKMLERPPK